MRFRKFPLLIKLLLPTLFGALSLCSEAAFCKDKQSKVTQTKNKIFPPEIIFKKVRDLCLKKDFSKYKCIYQAGIGPLKADYKVKIGSCKRDVSAEIGRGICDGFNSLMLNPENMDGLSRKQFLRGIAEWAKDNAKSLEGCQKACLSTCISSNFLTYDEENKTQSKKGFIESGEGLCSYFTELSKDISMSLGVNSEVQCGTLYVPAATKIGFSEAGGTHAMLKVKLENGAEYLMESQHEPINDQCNFYSVGSGYNDAKKPVLINLKKSDIGVPGGVQQSGVDSQSPNSSNLSDPAH